MQSEEEIKDIIEEILQDPFIVFSQDASFESTQIKAVAIQGLLNLYNKEKEQNNCLINEKNIYKELIKHAQEDVKIWRDLYNKEKEKNKELEKLNLTETTLYADGKIINKTIQLEDYISKDKIRAKIKELEEQKKYQEKVGLKYSEAGFFQGKINVLEELLEEE